MKCLVINKVRIYNQVKINKINKRSKKFSGVTALNALKNDHSK